MNRNPSAPRSRFVTVTAWASIILSALLLALAVVQTTALFVLIDEALLSQVASEVPAGFLGFARGVSIAFALITLFVLAASIGLLHRRNWARLAFLVMLAIGIVWSALGLVTYFWFGPGVAPPAGTAIGALTRWLEMASVVLSVLLIIASVWLIRRFTGRDIRNEFR